MAVDERTRELVYRALQPVIGDEAAAVVSRELPGSDVPTKADMDRGFEQVAHRFELVEAAIRELRYELLAAFRGELASQNRTMVLGMLGTAITVVLAAVALAQFF